MVLMERDEVLDIDGFVGALLMVEVCAFVVITSSVCVAVAVITDVVDVVV